MMAVASTLLFVIGKGLTFRYDEWAYIVYRRGWSVRTFLDPYNEHLSALPIATFKLLFASVGLSHYWPYRLTLIGFHLVCGALFFLLARRRVGPWLAVAASADLLFLGAAFDDLLWPVNVGFVGSTAAGLGALLFLDSGTRGRDLAASALVGISIASSGIGLAVAAGVLVEVLLRPTGPRRIWVPLVPLSLYALWFALDGPRGLVAGGSVRVNVTAVPAYLADAAAAAVGAVFGLGIAWGRILLFCLIVVAVRQVRDRISVRFVSLLTMAVTFWALTALARAQLHLPGSSRYLYFGAVLVLLLVVEAARGVQLRRPVLMAVAAIATFSVVANLDLLRHGEGELRTFNELLRPSLAALELAGPGTRADFRPDPEHAPPLTAGRYFAATSELGSPADTPAQLMREPEPLREAADLAFVGALGISARPMPRSVVLTTRPELVGEPHGTARAAGPCTEISGIGGVGGELAPHANALTVEAPAQAEAVIYVRRFADGYSAKPLAKIPSGQTRFLVLPDRPGPGSWHVRLNAPTGRLKACGADSR